MSKRNKFSSTGRRCTGCRVSLKDCVCGRGKLNRCIGCGGKLWDREGKLVQWGATQKELCQTCFKLTVDAAKYTEYAGP